MINRQIFPRVKRENLYKDYLKKIFAGASINITNLEIDILNCMKQNHYRWDSRKFTQELNISLQHLNNYKSNLIKKGLIVKNEASDNYITNPVHASWLYLPSNDKNESVYRLIIDFVVQDEDQRNTERENMEEDTRDFLEESLERERNFENSGKLLQNP